ncbi:MAG: AAA family ATPase, partial [Planctomycetaceae bacterium]|nr:AAA family ATPase [Planctomycetaceae bacterium]
MIESISLKNFRAFKDVEMRNIPPFCVVVGANGTGKSTIFNVLEFLRDAMASNVNTALSKLGGSRGIKEVRTRGVPNNEPIEITIKFRDKKVVNAKNKELLITYQIKINERNNKAYVEQEILSYRRGSKGQPWRFLDFSNGKGKAVTNEAEEVVDVAQLEREDQSLKSNDILAIKGLAQFERFPAVVALGELIENWCISDLHINKIRPEQEADYAEHLSREGENLSLVIQYLYNQHKEIFDKIIEKIKKRIPGIANVESKTTEEGRVLLKFQDGSFEDPFLAKFVSDGTIKMLAYLVLLNDPKPYPLLCIEEPENQLYPQLLEELAEEFREYANRGEQVLVSTHSP